MEKLKSIFKPFKSSVAYLSYGLFLSFFFLFIILNSYSNSPLVRIGYAFGLGLVIIAFIFYLLTSLNKKLQYYLYIIIALLGSLLAYGLLSISIFVGYDIWIVIYAFILSAFSLTWLIYKLIITIRNDNEHFCLVSFIYILMVSGISLSVGISKIQGFCKDNKAQNIAEIILKDVTNVMKDSEMSLNSITYLSYENESLLVGASSIKGDYLLLSYNYTGCKDIDIVFNRINEANEMSEFNLVTTFTSSFKGVGPDFELNEDMFYVQFKSVNNYQDVNHIDFVSGFAKYSTDQNNFNYCSFIKNVNNKKTDFFIFNKLGNQVVSSLIDTF